MVVEALSLLERGEGVWILGPPGGGRSHALHQIGERWPGELLRIRSAGLPWLSALPGTVLLCLDDAPEGIDRSALPAGRPVIAAGPRPGEGWSLLPLPPLSEDDSVRLFLDHAPEAGAMTALRALVRRLSGNPTAIIAAARRWPAEALASILERPDPDWPGLRPAYDALSAAERSALALLSRLPGPARHAGLVWCGHELGAKGLVTAGWVTVSAPGLYTLSAAIAACVRPWQAGDARPYFAWFVQEARERFRRWKEEGGPPDWFRSGLWPALHALHHYDREPWFFQAWLLSGEDTEALLAALAGAEGVISEILAARIAAEAHQRLGERAKAAEILRAAVARGAPEEPREEAGARLELAVAEHRLRNLDVAKAEYDAALAALEAQGMRRERLLCLANIAALAHAQGDHERARGGYQDAIAEAAALGRIRTRCHLSCNLGSLLLEMGELDAARAVLQLAVRHLDADLDTRMLALARSNQAVLELLEGHLDRADALLEEAVALFGEASPAMAALCLARRSAVAVLRGDLDRARQLHERAERVVPSGDPSTTRLVALWRALLEWEVGDRRSALARRRASLSGEAPLTAASGEARLAVQMLEQQAARPGEALLVGPDGTWFAAPGAPRVPVARYTAASQILAHLAAAAERQPGAFCPAGPLIAAGWPGEKISPEAARNRLAVALARLRKLGLRRLLQRGSEGWRLDPDFSVLLLQSALSPDEPAPR